MVSTGMAAGAGSCELTSSTVNVRQRGWTGSGTRHLTTACCQGQYFLQRGYPIQTSHTDSSGHFSFKPPHHPRYPECCGDSEVRKHDWEWTESQQTREGFMETGLNFRRSQVYVAEEDVFGEVPGEGVTPSLAGGWTSKHTRGPRATTEWAKDAVLRWRLSLETGPFGPGMPHQSVFKLPLLGLHPWRLWPKSLVWSLRDLYLGKKSSANFIAFSA